MRKIVFFSAVITLALVFVRETAPDFFEGVVSDLGSGSDWVVSWFDD